MPIPRHSMAVASVQLPLVARCEGVTELRVHGVGGSPPDAILGDLAPEQASGDQIAGFYRSADHRAGRDDETTGRDANRHVEAYSWGGLTSRSKVRVLWLALLPFLLTNLAGWMCSNRTRRSGWRFTLHRLSHGLSGLALTVNATLVAALIGADLLAHQAVRAGRAGHQWWLAPLGWHDISGFPARQLLIGMLVPVLCLALLTVLAGRSWRYEQVRPPFRGETEPETRKITASALPGGLAHPEFWDGEDSVKLLTWVHLAAAAGFLAVVLAVLASAGPAHWTVLEWLAIGAGGVAMAGAVELRVPGRVRRGDRHDAPLPRFPAETGRSRAGQRGRVRVAPACWRGRGAGRTARDGERGPLDRTGHRGGARPGLGLDGPGLAR